MSFGLVQKVTQRLSRLSKRTALLSSLGLLLFIGWLDYLTSVEMSLAAFYWIPVAIATLFHGTRGGFFLAASSVAFEIGTDISGGLAHSHPLFLVWDICTRFFSLAIFVWLLAKLKALYQAAQLTAQLQAELKASEAAYRELKHLSYIIGHNLYAPLRGIVGYSQLLRESYGEGLDAQARQYLQSLQQSGQMMARLIDALLDLIQVSGGKLEWQPVDLSAIASATAAELQQRSPGRKVEFSNEPELVTRGDAHLLKVVLQALLDNAWKFTTRQPVPLIAFGCRHEQDGPIYFVRDNGVGFNMAHANMLFGAFQSVHRKGEFEGLGIGLAMVERIIHRHGGRVWAEGVEGQGACFFFSLGTESSSVEK